MRWTWWSVLSLAAFLPAAAPPNAEKPLHNSNPLAPGEECATFALPVGFRAELVASEPNVIDPVCMAFDERGRIWVCEMRGYPNGGKGTGVISSGQIRLLEDRDGDGFYETGTVWAEGLRFPTGIMPWKGGLLVANAPDLIYLEDTRGTGKADRKRILYTGFDVANIQQLLNSLQFSLDNRIHACAGGAGGSIRSAEKPDLPAVELRGRGIQFQPDVPGSLEPTSGGGQYGLTADAWGRWFTATNSQHLRHIILPDAYLRRNPALAVRAVTLDIPEHGAACKVFRRSPFEAWRVERTTRRAGSPDAPRFPTTELVPGGYVTSGCSPLVYTADLFPPEYRNSVFVCDPANNLILRDTLTPSGATFVAKRAHVDREFLASTDNWFRPVHLTLGPDGAIYVLDFYREVIETPLSLPPDILARVNVQSRTRGRIWRITTAPAGKRLPRIDLTKTASRDLVAHLASANSWWRLTAQRLLYERQDRSAIEPLKQLTRSPSAVGRLHALWTLEGLGALEESLVIQGLEDSEPGVREQALRLAEPRLARSPVLQDRVVGLSEDPSPRVRFQLAFTLGAFDAPAAVTGLLRLARRADTDSWTQTAILSSASRCAPALLQTLMHDPAFARDADQTRLSFLARLASLVGNRASDKELAGALDLLGTPGKEPTPLQVALLDGLGQGLANSSRSLGTLWEKPTPVLAEAVSRAKKVFASAATYVADSRHPVESRVRAVGLLARGPFAPLHTVVPGLLTARTPPQLQLACVRALAAQPSSEVPKLLLAAWPGASPNLRREMAEALFAQKDRVKALLDAIDRKQIVPAQLEPARLALLRKHPDPGIRKRALTVLAGKEAPERGKAIEAYREALTLKADAARGKKVFQKNCVSCHRLEGVGTQVGAELLGALRNKSAEQLLIDILDPGREVDPRYLAYQVVTQRGQVLSGMLVAETASSLTLKRGEGAEDTILRTQIDTVESTGKSLMPEGLETQIPKQEMADLIAYLRGVK